MKKSPWAKLTMSSTPKISASPEATNARDSPTTRPFSSCSVTWSIGSGSHAEVRRGQLVRAPELVRPVGAHQRAAIHHIETCAGAPEQVEGGVYHQHAQAGAGRLHERVRDQLHVQR